MLVPPGFCDVVAIVAVFVSNLVLFAKAVRHVAVNILIDKIGISHPGKFVNILVFGGFEVIHIQFLERHQQADNQ